MTRSPDFLSFSYDGNGARASVSVTPPGGGAASVVKDYYQLGHLAYQTDGAGTLLASFTDDSTGAPVSVQVGSDPSSAPRYYDVYNAHGDVVSLVDASGASVASYDTWGHLLSSSERFPGGATGWSNPYRYDGRDGARYDASTGLYWLSVRAYDPTLGRFLSRDPLNRAPLFLTDNPYVYAGANPLSNVDPSGQYRAADFGAQAHESWSATKRNFARVTKRYGCGKACEAILQKAWWIYHIRVAKEIAKRAADYFWAQAGTSFGFFAPQLARLLGVLKGTSVWGDALKVFGLWIGKATFFTLLWATENVAVLTYDLIALAVTLFFKEQALQPDDYWRSPTNLDTNWRGIGVNMALFGSVLLGLVLPLLMVTMPDLNPLWIGMEIGLGVALFTISQRVKQFIDQEEVALNYPQS